MLPFVNVHVSLTLVVRQRKCVNSPYFKHNCKNLILNLMCLAFSIHFSSIHRVDNTESTQEQNKAKVLLFRHRNISSFLVILFYIYFIAKFLWEVGILAHFTFDIFMQQAHAQTTHLLLHLLQLVNHCIFLTSVVNLTYRHPVTRVNLNCLSHILVLRAG